MVNSWLMGGVFFKVVGDERKYYCIVLFISIVMGTILPMIKIYFEYIYIYISIVLSQLEFLLDLQ